jgi:hypothetical protein
MKNIFLVIGALLVAPFSFAQVNTGSTQSMIQAIVKGASGPTVNAVGTGIIATSAGQVLVPASGLRIAVPVSLAANVGKASITRAVMGALGGPLGGAVAVAAAVAPMLPRYHLCPAGSADVAAFYCRDADAPLGAPPAFAYYVNVGNGKYGATGDAACSAYYASLGTSFSGTYAGFTTDGGGAAVNQGIAGFCSIYVGTTFVKNHNQVIWVSCAGGMASNPACSGQPLPETLTKPQVEQTLQEKMTEDYNRNRQLYEALKKDQADAIAGGRPWPDTMNPVETGTGVVVTAPPVTTPERTTSTKTRTLPSGETETETKKEVTTITPETTGTTVGDSKTIYRTSTVITTTITNNTTNITNTSTETVADEVPEEPPPNECPPNTTLAKCSNLGQIPEKEVIPSQDVPVTYTPVSFQSSASCPSGIGYSLGSMGGSKVISYQPMCDWLSAIRPLFLALGALACAWIFMESLKS